MSPHAALVGRGMTRRPARHAQPHEAVTNGRPHASPALADGPASKTHASSDSAVGADQIRRLLVQ